MLLNIDLNSIKNSPEINTQVSTIQNNLIKITDGSLAVNLEPKQILLNRENIIQLQEVNTLSILQITSKKDDIDFNGIPRLEWLKGRDDNLYNETIARLSNGCIVMKNFSEIVERNINSETISHKDWKIIESYIYSFEGGVERNKEIQANTDDPIVIKVFNYILPKTQQRIDVLKQFLASKTKEPEIEFTPLKDVDIKENTDIATINSSSYEKTNDLLNFLVKDLKWYKWYLEDQKDCSMTYSLQFFQLTQSINYISTIGEV